MYKNKKIAEFPFVIRVFKTVDIVLSLMDKMNKEKIVNATVLIQSNAENNKAIRGRDLNGMFYFNGLEPGIYTYTATAPLYKKVQGQKAFTDDGAYVFNMTGLISLENNHSDSMQVKPEQENQVVIPGKMKIWNLKLNRTKIVMGHNENIGLSATIISGKGPYMVVKNVTNDVEWSTDNTEVVIQTAKGVIVSGDKDGVATIRAHYLAENGEINDAYCKVKVQNKENVADTHTFSIENYCDQKCYKKCQCGQSPDPEKCVTVRDNPNTPEDESYTSSECDALVSYQNCISNCHNDDETTCYLLCIRNETKKKKNYKININDYQNEKKDEVVKKTEIIKDNDENNIKNGPIGSHINRFSIKKNLGASDSQIQSSYWRGGIFSKGYWTEPVSFEHILGAKNILLKTGVQSDGYNTGWLLFVPKEKNEIQFRVYHFDFRKHAGIYAYGGTLNLHGKVVNIESLAFIKVSAYAATIQWKAIDGSIGRVRISKYKHSNNSMVQGGIKEILFIDAGNSHAKKNIKIPWKRIAQGVEQRFLKNWRCEIKIAPGGSRVEAVMKATGYNNLTYIVDAKGNIDTTLDKKKSYTLILGSGINRLPLPNSRLASEKNIIGYSYHFWKYDSKTNHLVALRPIQGKIGANDTCLPLDRNINGGQGQVKLFNYKNSVWPVRLDHGKLEAKGNQYGKNLKWNPNRWVSIGNHIDSFEGVGTGQGPLIVYRKKNTWTAVLLQYNTGEIIKKITKNRPIVILGGGKAFGVVIKIGDSCYDFSSNNRKRTPELDCSTGRLTGGAL